MKDFDVLQTQHMSPVVDLNLEELSNLKRDISKLEQLGQTIKLLSTSKETPVVTLIQQDKYVKIKEDFSKLGKLYKGMKEVQSKLELIKEKVSNLKEQMAEFKVCPLCGSELKNE